MLNTISVSEYLAILDARATLALRYGRGDLHAGFRFTARQAERLPAEWPVPAYVANAGRHEHGIAGTVLRNELALAGVEGPLSAPDTLRDVG